MHKDVLFRIPIFSELYSTETETIEHQPFVLILTKDHRFSVLEVNHPIGTGYAVRYGGMRPVIENNAVLQDFHYGSTIVLCSRQHYLRGEG